MSLAATRDQGEPLWPGSFYQNGAKMIRADLGDIEEETDRGRVDFHSLRHSHVTEVVRTGASISEVLRICRLSTPILLDRYYHSDAKDQEAVILKLPRTKLA